MGSLRQLAPFLVVVLALLPTSACRGPVRSEEAVELSYWNLPFADVPRILPGPVSTAVEDESGTLWFGGVGGLTRYEPETGKWRLYTKEDGGGSSFPRSIAITIAGEMFMSAQEGLFHYDPETGLWASLDEPNDTEWPSFGILRTSTLGGFWFASEEGLSRHFLVRFDPSQGGIVEKLEPPRDSSDGEQDSLRAFDESPNGDIWAFFDEAGLVLAPRDSRRWEHMDVKALVSAHPFSIVAAPNDIVWISSNKGLFRFDASHGNSRKYDQDDGLPSGDLFALSRDSKGGIWLGSMDGLYHLRPGHDTFRKIVETESYRRLEVVLEDSSGRLWLSSYGSPYLLAFDPQTERQFRFPHSSALFPNRLDSLHIDDAGWIWAQPAYRVFRSFSSSGQLLALQILRNDGLQWRRGPQGSWRTRWLSRNSDKLWLWGGIMDFAGSIEGVDLTAPQEVWLPLEEERFEKEREPSLTAAFGGRDGRLWLALEGRGLNQCTWDTRECKRFGGLVGNLRVRTIQEDSRGGIWTATAESVVRWGQESGERLGEWPIAGVVAMTADLTGNIWLAGAQGLFHAAGDVPPELVSERVLDEVLAMRFDRTGALWMETDQSGILRYHGASKSWRDFGERWALRNEEYQYRSSEGSVRPHADPSGRIWFLDERGVGHQEWHSDGTPKRPVVYYFSDLYPRLAVAAATADGVNVWMTRPTGLLSTGGERPEAFAYAAKAAPITTLAADGEGGAWLGHSPGGLTHYTDSGETVRVTQEEGLPDDNVRDLSPVLGKDLPTVWVATDGGVARVTPEGIELTADVNGPVDSVASVPDGGAWLAFNPIPEDLYLDPALAQGRQFTYLQRIDADGGVMSKVDVPQGTVRDLVFEGDSEGTLWVGSSSGLYRVVESASGGAEINLVTSQGRLPQVPARELVLDPTGTIWMTVDALSPEGAAAIYGYRPDIDDFVVLNERTGLPKTPRLDSLFVTPGGDLAVLAAHNLLAGRVFVPARGIHPSWLAAAVVGLIFVGAASARLAHLRRERAARAEAHRPFLTLASEFFSRLGRDVERLDYRTLRLRTARDSADPECAIRTALGDLVRVEEVIDLFDSLPGEEGQARHAYLIYPRELDPAARRQLDTYRLRRSTIIVPLSVPFLRSKLEEGVESMRAALDGLRRRYIGEQDLFDFRNALDEPRFFFGRRALLSEMHRALSRGEHIALMGPRKSGKSSVLNLLQQSLEAFPVAKVDLQLFDRKDPEWPNDLFRSILDRYDGWGQARFESAWAESRGDGEGLTGPKFLRELEARREKQAQLGNYQPLIVLLDEIERVFPRTKEGEFLRSEAEHFNRAAGVLRSLGQEAGERLIGIVVADIHATFNRVNRFHGEGTDTNPFYRFFQEFFLPPLAEDECSEMLVEIGHAMGLTVMEDLRARIFSDSGGHAALARQLASAATRERRGAVEVKLDHYHEGLSRMMDETGDIDIYFSENFWNPASSAERAVLCAAASMKGVTEDILRFLDLPITHVQEARRELSATGVLEQVDKRYRVRGALFRDWLSEQCNSG